MIKKCLKKVKIFEWPVFTYSFSPIVCSVMKTVWQTVFKICNSNHKYLDNQTGDCLDKFMGFLTDLKVYNYHATWAKSRILFQNLRQSYPIPLIASQEPLSIYTTALSLWLASGKTASLAQLPEFPLSFSIYSTCTTSNLHTWLAFFCLGVLRVIRKVNVIASIN